MSSKPTSSRARKPHSKVKVNEFLEQPRQVKGAGWQGGQYKKKSRHGLTEEECLKIEETNWTSAYNTKKRELQKSIAEFSVAHRADPEDGDYVSLLKADLGELLTDVKTGLYNTFKFLSPLMYNCLADN